jgi:hypothetical protein
VGLNKQRFDAERARRRPISLRPSSTISLRSLADQAAFCASVLAAYSSSK